MRGVLEIIERKFVNFFINLFLGFIGFVYILGIYCIYVLLFVKCFSIVDFLNSKVVVILVF